MATRRGRYRTKLCRNFALGHCPQGDKCNYIHASPESIQSNTIGSLIQPSLSQRSNDDPLSASNLSPLLWPTLSPVTNTSSDYPAYNWSTSSNIAHPSSCIKYRPLSWRTTLCRHYLKNRGWCPVGDQCNYIHDLTLAEFAKDDVRFSKNRNSSGFGGKHVHGERGKVGSKHSHCWAYVQGLCHVQDCQYLHPASVQMFAAHTPCLAWPNCRRGPLCPYKHPEPYISNSPTTSPSLAPAKAMRTNPPATQLDTVPRAAMQYNGTYFYPQQPAPAPPALLPSLPAPHSSIPHQQMPVIFTNPWEGWQLPYTPASVGYTAVAVNPSAWPGAALGYNDALSGNRTPALQHFVPQFARPQGLPMAEYPEEAIPRQMSMAMTMANYALRPSEEPSPSNPLNLPPPKTRAYSTPADEFPYAPPKEQRNGHARRISVSTKSVNREAMDALGLDSPTTESASGRLPWQTHSDRLARRSWAPSSSSVRAAQATPPPVLYGM